MRSAAGAAMFDTERVEVLKGPQGTLYGRNATGGLVHLLSRRPTDTVEGYVDAEVSEFSTTRFTGVVSGPLSDSVRGRVSVMKQDSDGYYENRLGPDLLWLLCGAVGVCCAAGYLAVARRVAAAERRPAA